MKIYIENIFAVFSRGKSRENIDNSRLLFSIIGNDVCDIGLTKYLFVFHIEIRMIKFRCFNARIPSFD